MMTRRRTWLDDLERDARRFVNEARSVITLGAAFAERSDPNEIELVELEPGVWGASQRIRRRARTRAGRLHEDLIEAFDRVGRGTDGGR